MKLLLKLEEAGLFILAIYWFSQLHFAWWWFPVLLLAPDISMAGYVFNPKTGAYIYNFFHHRLAASIVAIYGLIIQNEYWQLAALILFAHISMDRIFRFGLKHTTGFQYTHLKKLKQKQPDFKYPDRQNKK